MEQRRISTGNNYFFKVKMYVCIIKIIIDIYDEFILIQPFQGSL